MNAFNLNIREYKRNLDGSIDSITLENGQQFESDVGEIEKNKTVTITENGTVTIKPSAGKDAMKKVTATVDIPLEAERNASINVYATRNGTFYITPLTGKVAMKSVKGTLGNIPRADSLISELYTIDNTFNTEVTLTYPLNETMKGYITIAPKDNGNGFNTANYIRVNIDTFYMVEDGIDVNFYMPGHLEDDDYKIVFNLKAYSPLGPNVSNVVITAKSIGANVNNDILFTMIVVSTVGSYN